MEYQLKISDNPEFIIITDYINDEMEAISRDHGICENWHPTLHPRKLVST
jgi:hypothetical protein